MVNLFAFSLDIPIIINVLYEMIKNSEQENTKCNIFVLSQVKSSCILLIT